MNFKPDILQCATYCTKSNAKHGRVVKDYEIDIYIDGERDMYIDGSYYKISGGCVVFRKPGQLVVSYGDYNCLMLTLDFSNSLCIPQQQYTRTHKLGQQPADECEILNSIPAVFFPEHIKELIELMKKIEGCCYPNLQNPELSQQYLAEFLFLLLADATNHNRTHNKKADNDYIKTACDYIKENYSSEITVSYLAQLVCLNENYFIRIFRERLGVTPNKYILDLRLFHAKNMLLETDLSSKEIAFSCGFNTPSYFSSCFKKRYKKSPEKYREFKV